MFQETYVDKNGYLRYSSSGKLVHRDVAKRKYGTLSKWDQVHHIDANKLNNQPANLMKLSKSEHEIIHHKSNKAVQNLNSLDYALGKAIINALKGIFKIFR